MTGTCIGNRAIGNPVMAETSAIGEGTAERRLHRGIGNRQVAGAQTREGRLGVARSASV